MTVVRLEEDGGFVRFAGWVSGSVFRPDNEARYRRVDMGLGPDHWDLLALPVLGPFDEAYYEESYPALGLSYYDGKEIRVLHRVNHADDPGAGLHRWIFPDEDWVSWEAWKWQIGSVHPDVHYEWRKTLGEAQFWAWS